MKQRSVLLSPEGGRNRAGAKVGRLVRPEDDGRVEAVERGVGDALVAVDERDALAVDGAGEPVAIFLLRAVAAHVAFRTFASERKWEKVYI